MTNNPMLDNGKSLVKNNLGHYCCVPMNIKLTSRLESELFFDSKFVNTLNSKFSSYSMVLVTTQ